MCKFRSSTQAIGVALLLVCCFSVGTNAAQPTCNVRDHGAKGNGVDYDTEAIQKAVAECSRPGSPGTVLFEANKSYLTATIVLSNSVHVVLPANSTLLAGTKREDFGPAQRDWYLVMFDQCRNCSITGGGTLDGRARLWVTGWRDNWIKNVRNFQDPSCYIPGECRPRLLGVRDSEKVHVSDITLTDSIYWTLHVIGSRAVTILQVNIINDFAVPNNDGIDIDSSKLVWVSGANITAWDDAMCIKANYPGVSTEDVLVENSTLHSRASAVKIGTESHANFRTLVFQNINIVDSHRGLSIQLRDNGTVENVLFNNINMTVRQYNGGDEWGGSEPIYVTAIPRNQATKVGSIGAVLFKNIRAVTEAGVLVVGSNGSTITDLTIENFSLSIQKLSDGPGGFHDLRPPLDTGNRTGVQDDAIYLEHANHVNISGVKVEWGTPRRPTWGQALRVLPGTVHALTVEGLVVHDESAHPEHIEVLQESLLPLWSKAATGARDWMRSLRSRASTGSSLSLQENAALGVQAQPAASSASAVMMSITGVVLAGIVVAHVLDFRLLSRFHRSSKAIYQRLQR